MKIAVVGTSNIGAVKYAEDQIAAAHPSFSITCFGLPGGRFNSAYLAGSEFGPDRNDTATMKLSRRVNGAPTLNLMQFDHVLVIGDTLGLPAVLWCASNYDIADWPSRTGRPLLSEAALRAATEEAIAARANHLRTQFGDLPLFVAHAPYPTTEVVPKGEYHQMPYAAMANHPEAVRLHALYLDALTRNLVARNMILVPQPKDTIASPFLTKANYGRGSMDFRAKGQLLNDHRHMNADFGASLFHAFTLALNTDATAPQRQEG